MYPPPNTSFGTHLAASTKAVVSPDGTRLVFAAADRGGRSQLWIRALDSFEALPVPGSEGASVPFWSPDSRSIGFFVGARLKRIDAVGGSPQTICDVERVPRGASWGAAGDIVFSVGGASRLYRVPERGGKPVALSMTPGETLFEPGWPSFLPDGRSFLYWARDPVEGAGVYARTLETDAVSKRVVASDSQAAYDPSGFLLFSRAGVLLRQPFDPVRFEVSGEPTPVVEGVYTVMVMGGALFSVSNNGVLTFQPDLVTSQFTWVDRSGNITEKVGIPGRYLNRQVASKITSGGTAVAPVWSNDGQAIFYRKPADKNVPGGIYRINARGGTDEKLFFEGRLNGPSQVTRDGKWLLFFATPEGQSVQDIYVLPMTGERKPQRIVASPYSDVEPQFSPDGRFVAYASSQTGRLEVFVEPFPATGERWQISSAGGRQPLWRDDGKELYFVSDVDLKFYAVPIKAGPRFDWDSPSALFEMRANVGNTRNSYIPAADGKHFLINMALDSISPINVIRNWTAGLKD